MSVAGSVLRRLGFVVLRQSDVPRVVDGDTIRQVTGFQRLYTAANVDDLYEPAFDAALRHATAITHNADVEKLRARCYFSTMFAEMALGVRGDMLFVGVHRGIVPHCIHAYLGDRLGDKRLVLVDPWSGARTRDGERDGKNYTDDFEDVRATFSGAPADFVRDYVPDALPALSDRRYCYMLLNTGDPRSEIASIPTLFAQLGTGGAMIIAGYGGHQSHKAFREAISGLPATTINLLNGMAVLIKHA
jgi:hypothetical protein